MELWRQKKQRLPSDSTSSSLPGHYSFAAGSSAECHSPKAMLVHSVALKVNSLVGGFLMREQMLKATCKIFLLFPCFPSQQHPTVQIGFPFTSWIP